MFYLTPSAAEQIRRAAAEQTDDAATPSLRVAAKVEDGELVYGMGFDEERENDVALEVEGVIVLIAPRSRELLLGATLDFVELKPGEFQFIFINPNEGSACAGQSGGGCTSCGNRSPNCN